MALAFLKLSFQVLMFFRILWLTTGTTDCFCYKLNTQKSSWRVSRFKCIQGGGDLVTMETEEKWKFINSKIQGINEGINEWHIGLEKKGEEWKWVNNQTLSITKWQRDEPNDDGSCVAMAKNFPPGTQGLLKNLPCTSRLMYICEYRQGNSRCKSTYFPPGCNETNPLSTPTEPTQFVLTTYEPTITMGATIIRKTRANTPTPNNKTSLTAATTPAYLSKDASEPFPITLMAAIIGILLVVIICLIIAVCFWKTGGIGFRSKHKEDSQRNNASEIADVPGIELNVMRTSKSKSKPQNMSDTNAAIYAEIEDDHGHSNPQTSTYAEVHNCLSPCSAPAPEYLAPYEAVEQHKGPAYQPLDKKDSREDDVALTVADYENAPNTANRNGVPQVEPDEQITIANAVYATVDKSMKKKSVQKQVEPVYAQVNKNGKN